MSWRRRRRRHRCRKARLRSGRVVRAVGRQRPGGPVARADTRRRGARWRPIAVREALASATGWRSGNACDRQITHRAQSCAGWLRLLLRRLRPVVGVADRNVPDRIGADGQRRQRDRGEEKDLAPDGEQRRGKPDRGFQPLERDVAFRSSICHAEAHSNWHRGTFSFARSGRQVACQAGQQISTTAQRGDPETGWPIR